MTNAWGDVGNTKLLMVLGSNFVENHPGVVQWANDAMEKNWAKFVVVDPRRTRTVAWGLQKALGQATGSAVATGNSAFAQIRPGTNGALMAGLMRYAIENTAFNNAAAGINGVSSGTTATGTTTRLDHPGQSWTANQFQNWYIRLTGPGYEPSWHKITSNTTNSITFTPAANAAVSGTAYEVWYKPLVDSAYVYNYTDAMMRLNTTDYKSSGDVTYFNDGTINYKPLFHDGGAAGSTSRAWSAYADKFSPKKCWDNLNTANGTGSASVFMSLKDRVKDYLPETAAEICGISTSEFNTLAEMVTDPLNRPGCIMYAMGGTQHTSAGQDLRAYCILQCLLGNISKNGSGVNALRGIHNVQGSTDQGVLYSSMPGYSDVPDTQGANTTWYNYMNTLFGNNTGTGLQQVGFRNMMHHWFRQGTGEPAGAGLHNGAYSAAGGAQNYGFDLLPLGIGYNHRKMFQQASGTVADKERVWFMMCLGQNPAVTEPNLARIRAGLNDLDTLVCVDLYASETATCSRKSTGYTILLPSAAHVEEAGSVTSSARMIYWRYMARPPQGNSKTDLEILLRLAKKCDDKNLFSHISGYQANWGGDSAYKTLYGKQYHGWDPNSIPDFSAKIPAASGSSEQYHPNGLERYIGEAVAEEVFKQMAGPAPADGVTGVLSNRGGDKIHGTLWIYTLGYMTSAYYSSLRWGDKLASAPTTTTSITTSNAISGLSNGDKVIVGNFGAVGTNADENSSGGNEETVTVTAGAGTTTLTISPALAKTHYAGEPVTPRGAWSYESKDGILAKSRATYDPGRNKVYGRFGWAWLYNRHIFYNNNPCGTPYTDKQPGSVNPSPSRTGGASHGNNRYGAAYLTYCEDTCPNRPVGVGPGGGGNGTCKAPGDTYDYFVAPDSCARLFVHHKSSSGRNPGAAHADTRPVRDDVTVNYRKYSALADYDHHDTAAAGTAPSRFPKHWEPHETPSSTYYSTYGRTGDTPLDTPAAAGSTTYPYVLTTWRICWHFQGGPMSRNVPWLAELDPEAFVEINSADAYEKGIKTGDNVRITTVRQTGASPGGEWKAKVGTGTQANQNIKRGVVGVPWHWGKALGLASSGALVEGPSANEHCIDAMETNVKMPESKACLCDINKV